MPEAPWIRRCSYGIKFTDDILNDEEDGDDQDQDNDNLETSNAPKKNSGKNEQEEAEVETPYQQSIEVNKASKAAANNMISEKIMQNAMVYLVDHDEEQLSDKHKISLFDDSKFEDLTMDGGKGKSHQNKVGKDSLLDEAALMRGTISDGEEEEDDDSSS